MRPGRVGFSTPSHGSQSPCNPHDNTAATAPPHIKLIIRLSCIANGRAAHPTAVIYSQVRHFNLPLQPRCGGILPHQGPHARRRLHPGAPCGAGNMPSSNTEGNCSAITSPPTRLSFTQRSSSGLSSPAWILNLGTD